jgi:glycosyltransferase involved in cell wall biosynthesis
MRCCFHGFSGNTQRACVSGPTVLGLPPSGWEVTYNGLDFSLLAARVPRTVAARTHGILLDGRPIIGTSANLRAWKRIDLLLNACAQIKDLSFSVLIVGDGPDRDRLEKLTDDLGLRPRVIFTGRQDHVPDYLALMDIFVLPSNSEESFGNSVVEAMAMGLPSIVFHDGGGLTEHIEDGRSGYVVREVQQLAERLRQLIADPGLRLRLGAAASASVRAKYGLEAMTRCYDGLYRAALVKSGYGLSSETSRSVAAL